jgi:hypothetical protein
MQRGNIDWETGIGWNYWSQLKERLIKVNAKENLKKEETQSEDLR